MMVMLEQIIKEWGGTEVSSLDVYSDIFHIGENLIQRVEEPNGFYKSNPLAYWKNNADVKGHYRILFDDTFEETLQELQKADFSIMNGITYFGRKNLMQNASKMYALIFDLDGVTDVTLNNFFSGAFNAEVYPIPNYVVLSGHGVHLYYVFEEPISLYPNIKLQLKDLKYALTTKMWNMYTSTFEKKQYQGINQGFRVIGGKTKIDGFYSRAFQINKHSFTIKKLCEFVPLENRVDEGKLWKETHMTLEQAKEKFPLWYEKRVLNNQPRGTWTCKTDLYQWWIRKIKEGAEVGHRYFCIMCLAIYAVKCGISYEQLKNDALELVPVLNDLNPSEPFTEDDCKSALECYDEKYITFPIDDIRRITGIEIEKNKRNGRSRADHIKVMNAMKELKKQLGEEVNNGRPKGSSRQRDAIEKYQLENPGAYPKQCIQELNISKTTVYRWWKK